MFLFFFSDIFLIISAPTSYQY